MYYFTSLYQFNILALKTKLYYIIDIRAFELIKKKNCPSNHVFGIQQSNIHSLLAVFAGPAPDILLKLLNKAQQYDAVY